MGRYLTAAVCLKGHTASDGIEKYPAQGKFCEQCGAEVITACPACNASIKGDYYVEGYFGPSHFDPPAFCRNCGRPFPWTVERLAAAKELADELEGVSADDRSKIKEALDDVSANGPRTELGAARLKKLLGNATNAIGQAAWKISVDIASETAKKIMLGQ